MSSTTENNVGITLLSPQQIETLQHQIRQFKNLGKKFSESKVPKLIESIQQAPNAQNIAKSVVKEQPKEPAAPKEAPPPQVVAAPIAPAAPVQPTLSWQCFNSLLFCGPNKFPQDGAISFSSSVSIEPSFSHRNFYNGHVLFSIQPLNEWIFSHPLS